MLGTTATMKKLQVACLLKQRQRKGITELPGAGSASWTQVSWKKKELQKI
jgi:hypothetical protein